MATNACGGVLYQLDYSNSISASASKVTLSPIWIGRRLHVVPLWSS